MRETWLVFANYADGHWLLGKKKSIWKFRLLDSRNQLNILNVTFVTNLDIHGKTV